MNNLLYKKKLTQKFLVEIGISEEERKEIFNFRYQVYIKEMSKQIETVDSNMIYDELDEWGVLLYVKVETEIVATARMNIGLIEKYPKELISILQLDKFKNYKAPVALLTKLMIDARYRNSSILYLLISKCYELAFNNGVEFIFGGANFHLLRLYERIGLQRYTHNFIDPGYGLLSPIILLVNDIEHLRNVRSPLVRIARKRVNVNLEAVNWFYKNFNNSLSALNSQLISEEKLWEFLCLKIQLKSLLDIKLLKGLSIMEAKKFLYNCGVHIICNEGDIITQQGDLSYSYNILLSGKFRSLTFKSPVKNYVSPGQRVGAQGLLGHDIQVEDIVSVGNSELFVLSGLSFPKFAVLYPKIADLILNNLK